MNDVKIMLKFSILLELGHAPGNRSFETFRFSVFSHFFDLSTLLESGLAG